MRVSKLSFPSYPFFLYTHALLFLLSFPDWYMILESFYLLLPSFALFGSGGWSPRPPTHTAPELSKYV